MVSEIGIIGTGIIDNKDFVDVNPVKIQYIDDIKLEDLRFSMRIYNALDRSSYQIRYLSDIVALGINQYYCVRNLGEKSLNEIVAKIHGMGLLFFGEDSHDKDVLVRIKGVNYGDLDNNDVEKIEDVILEGLGLSQRSYNKLKENGFNSLADIVEGGIGGLRSINCLDSYCYNEIVNKVHSFGVPFYGERIGNRSVILVDRTNLKMKEGINSFKTVNELISANVARKRKLVEKFQELERKYAKLRCDDEELNLQLGYIVAKYSDLLKNLLKEYNEGDNKKYDGPRTK